MAPGAALIRRGSKALSKRFAMLTYDTKFTLTQAIGTSNDYNVQISGTQENEPNYHSSSAAHGGILMNEARLCTFFGRKYFLRFTKVGTLH